MECYYFGTFNPVHIGHIQTAKDIIAKFGCNKIFFVPAYIPCHKEVLTSASDRFNMLKLIEDENIKVSDIEYTLSGPSYSYRTVMEILKNKPFGEKLNYIIGFDAFINIEKWKNYQYLKQNVHFIVLKRKGEKRCEIEQLREKGFDFEIMDSINEIDVSSTEIRDKVKNGDDISELVDKKVERYILENELYR